MYVILQSKYHLLTITCFCLFELLPSSTGASSCISCDTGWFSITTGKAIISSWDFFTMPAHQKHAGASSCLACSVGFFSNISGTANLFQSLTLLLLRFQYVRYCQPEDAFSFDDPFSGVIMCTNPFQQKFN